MYEKFIFGLIRKRTLTKRLCCIDKSLSRKRI